MEAARAMPAPARVDPGRSSNGGLALATPAAPVERERDAGHLELPPPDRLSGATLATLAAVAGMAAIALGLWAFATSVSDDGSTQIVRPPISEAAQAISLLSKPTTVRLPLAGADERAVLAVAANGRGLLVLDGFGIAPVGRTYQAWVISQRPRSTPLTGALFTGVETVVPLTARVEPGAVVGITTERAGGASAPSESLTVMTQRPVDAG
jgi:Anti-sigma-K factor rskA